MATEAEWRTLQHEFAEIHNKQSIDPPFLSFSGIAFNPDSETVHGWTECRVSGFDKRDCIKLKYLSDRAAVLLPPAAWNGRIGNLLIPSPVREVSEFSIEGQKWALFVASVTGACSTNLMHPMIPPCVEFDAHGPYKSDQNGEPAVSFTGRIHGYAAACELTIDKLLLQTASETTISAPTQSPPRRTRKPQAEKIKGLLLAHHELSAAGEIGQWSAAVQANLVNKLQCGKSTVSEFFTKEFGDNGYDVYQSRCNRRSPELASKLAEFAGISRFEFLSGDAGDIEEMASRPNYRRAGIEPGGKS
jgi:hypothetical protein